MLKFGLGMFAILTIAVVYGASNLPPDTVDFLIWAMHIAGYTCIAVPVVGLVCGAIVWRARQSRRERTYRDGAVPIQHIRRRVWRSELPTPLAMWTFIIGDKIIIDPNLMISFAYRITPLGEVIEAAPAAGWERQLARANAVEQTNMARAFAQGDDSRDNYFGRDSAPVRIPARALTQRAPAQLTGPVDDDAVDGTFTPIAMPLSDALRQSNESNFVLGHNDQGDVLAFNPTQQQNLGIVGATGTGKTTATGFHLLLLALKFGWHPLILDPKGGTDLRPFAEHGEWRPTDADVFGEQIATVRQEHQRRYELLVKHQAAHVDELRSDELRHILVFVEEYGSLWEEIETSKKRAEIDRINSDIDTMMRLSRMTGIHFCFVDQFPEKWSQQVFMAAKMRLVYQVAPGQGAFLHEYKADALPDRGTFMYRRQTWQSWHVKPELRTLLFDTPMSQYPELIAYKPGVRQMPTNTRSSGVREGVRLVVDPPPPDPANTGKWDAWIGAYMGSHPGLYDDPPQGVRQMARAMSAHDSGSEDNFTRYVGIASDTARVIRDERRANYAMPITVSAAPATVAEQLAALGIDPAAVTVGKGEPLGTDRTHNGNGNH